MKIFNAGKPTCNRDCKELVNNTEVNTSFLYLANAMEGLMFEGKFSSQEPYLTVGFDFLYYSTDPIRVAINGIDFGILSPSQFNKYEQPSQGYKLMEWFQFSYTSLKTERTYENDYVSVKLWGEKPFQQLFLRKMKIWTNCVENCSECNGRVSCNKCTEGFKLKLDYNGNGICEQRRDCSNIPNCQQCFPGADKCRICEPGFKLKNSGICEDLNSQQISCNVDQYFDSQTNQCQNFSQKCFIKSDQTTPQDCSHFSNLVQYKCSKNHQVLYYNQDGYSVVRCGCVRQNCKYCEDPSTCQQCNSGFYNDSQKNLCISNCKSDQYYDEDQNICVDCGNSCLTCNSSQCTQCKNSFQLLQSDKQNCVQCSISNCVECSSKNICSQCRNGFRLDSSLNYCVSNTCKVSNCLKCNPYNTNQCQVCESNYQITQNFQCTNCFVSNCYQCGINSNICKICNSGYYADLNKQCSEIIILPSNQKLQLTFQQSVTFDGYILKINSNKAFKYIPESTSILNVGITNTNIKLQNTVINNQSLTVHITLDQNVKGQTVSLTIQDSLFIQANQIEQQSFEQELTPFVVINSDQQEQLEQLQGVSNSVQSSMVAGFVPAVFFGNFYVIINMIDMTGYLYYLLYVNIRLPQNVIDFYGIFQDFQFPFIPNLFKNILPTEYIQESPKKFMEMQADCYFIKNAGQSMTIITAIFCIYGFIKLLSKVKIKFAQPYFQGILVTTWEYGAFFDMIGTIYLYVLVSSLLQFYEFDNGDKRTYLLNYFLHAIFTIIAFSVPFTMIYFIYRQKNIKEDDKMQKKLSSLVGGLKLYNESPTALKTNTAIQSDINLIQKKNQKTQHQQQGTEIMDKGVSTRYDQSLNAITMSNNSLFPIPRNKKTRRQIHIEKYSKYLNGFQYARKLIFCILIVYFHDYTLVQMAILNILPVWSAIFYFYITPHEKYADNLKNGICELLLLAIQLTFYTLINDDEDQVEEERINIGWVIITFSLIILLWNFIGMVLDLIHQFFLYLKRVCICLHVLKNPQIKPENTNPSQILKDKKQMEIKLIKDQSPQSNENHSQNMQKAGETKQTIQINITHNLIVPSLSNYSPKSNTNKQNQTNSIQLHTKNEQIVSGNICSIDENAKQNKNDENQINSQIPSFSNPSNFPKEEQNNNREIQQIEIISNHDNNHQMNTEPSLSQNNCQLQNEEKDNHQEITQIINEQTNTEAYSQNNIINTRIQSIQDDHLITYESSPSIPYANDRMITQMDINSQLFFQHDIFSEQQTPNNNQNLIKPSKLMEMQEKRKKIQHQFITHKKEKQNKLLTKVNERMKVINL